MHRFLSVFIACFFLCQPALGAPINRVVAVVNGDMVTEFDLNRLAAPAILRTGLDLKNPAHAEAIAKIRRDVLQSRIQDIIVVQEAERLQVKVDDAEVDKAIARLRQESKVTEEQFNAQLKAQKLTMEEFRSQMRKSLLNRDLLGHMVARKVVITKEEIEKYYNDHPEMFSGGRNVRIALLVYPPTAKVEQVAASLKKGRTSFESVVRELSIGPKKEEGGDLGMMPWSDLSPALRDVLSSMQPGSISDPFDLNGMAAQIKLLDKQDTGSGEVLPLEQVSGQIEGLLREPRLHERFKEYMEQLRRRAVVDIRL